MTHFLRFNHHTQREGEQYVEEHNNHDGDRDPHHELLVLRHLVLEGGVAAFEVEGVVLRGVGGANLRAACVHLTWTRYFNSIFLPFTATLNTHKYDYLGSLICEMFFVSDLPLNQSEYTADTLSSNQNRVDHRKWNFNVIFTLAHL